MQPTDQLTAWRLQLRGGVNQLHLERAAMTSQQRPDRLTDDGAGLLNARSLALLQAKHHSVAQQGVGVVADLVAHVTQPAQQRHYGCASGEDHAAVLVHGGVTLVLVVDPAAAQQARTHAEIRNQHQPSTLPHTMNPADQLRIEQRYHRGRSTCPSCRGQTALLHSTPAF